jgi:hypothetical protein
VAVTTANLIDRPTIEKVAGKDGKNACCALLKVKRSLHQFLGAFQGCPS